MTVSRSCPPAAVAAVLALACFAIAVPSAAADESLLCHKVKDGQKFKGAVVDIAAASASFSVPAGCSIVGKAADFCTAASVTIVSTDASGGASVADPQGLSGNDYVCYKLKCSGEAPAAGEVEDPFGARAMEFKTPGKLCVPALAVSATTTTDTTTTTEAPTTTTTVTTTTTTTTIPCPGGTPSAEVCNNVDDNCNGTVDDGLYRTCYTGPSGTAGVGACRTGQQTCSAGSWGSSCPNEVTPKAESCNGTDDDCDGSVDEQLVCP
ncbi:MAG TPA: MopE-related protein [Candidatus Limnocylindrales bacterium]|nr:MopE-related protein [Candidatus Limnocylindrales bacterium]